MKIHFIVGPFGSGRQKIFKKLLGVLKQRPDTKIGFDGMDDGLGKGLVSNSDSTGVEYCLFKIDQQLKMFERCDDFVFTGTVVSAHIKSIMTAYPDAALYMVRRSDSTTELTSELLETISSNLHVSAEWITACNAEVRAAHEAYADELGIPWKPVNSPVFIIDNVPNWAEDNEVSDTTIEMAAHNL